MRASCVGGTESACIAFPYHQQTLTGVNWGGGALRYTKGVSKAASKVVRSSFEKGWCRRMDYV